MGGVTPAKMTAQLLRGSAVLVALGIPLLAGCCNQFYWSCFPVQPASITAQENVQTFVSARDQAEGLLSEANRVFNPDVVSRVTPDYQRAASAANAWIDYAQGALNSTATFDAAHSSQQLDAVTASVRAFADTIEASAIPGNMKVPFRPLPEEAVLDPLTGSPPIAAAAEAMANGVAQGVESIKAAQGPVSQLDPGRRAVIASTIVSGRWAPAGNVLAAPTGMSFR